MKFLLDAHLMLWSAGDPKRLSAKARELINEPASELFFSAASLWEIAIKSGLGAMISKRMHASCAVDYSTTATANCPSAASRPSPLTALPTHKYPFDRMLVEEAMVEGIMLLTSDAIVAQQPGAVRRV